MRTSILRWLALGQIWLLFAACCVPTAAQSQGNVQIADEQLLRLARDTFERRDYIYASLHLNAILQRNPPILRQNPTQASQLQKLLVYSIDRLQELRADSEQLPATKSRLSSCQDRLAGGGTGVSEGLTRAPPKPPSVDWPRLGV